MTPLKRFASWYEGHCNGEWEHQYGVTIETIDNPGWHISVSLSGTDLENRPYSTIKEERSDNDWLHARRSKETLDIYCGPTNLEEALDHFCTWAGI